MAHYVYTIKVNDLPYYGYTNNFPQRMRHHLNCAKRKNTRSKFHQALRLNDLKFELVELRAFATEELALLYEIMLIKQNPANLNKDKGGSGTTMYLKMVNGVFKAIRKRKKRYLKFDTEQ